MYKNNFSLQRGYIFLGTLLGSIFQHISTQIYPFMWYIGGFFFLIFGSIYIYKKGVFLLLFSLGISFSFLSPRIHRYIIEKSPQIESTDILTGQIMTQLAMDRRRVDGPLGKYIVTTSRELTPGDIIAFLPGLPWYLKYPSPQSSQYQKRLSLKGYRGSYTPFTLSVIDHYPPPIIFQIRELLYNRLLLVPLESTTNALLRGMLWGDTSSLTKQQIDNFVASGLIHIVAVSGSNMSFIIILGCIFFWRIPLFLRQYLLAGCIFIYATICGRESSVVRAVCFGLIMLGSLLMGRPGLFRQMFFLVATAMLWWSPDIVMYDRGRWLSFAATGTIMLYNTILKAKFPDPTQRQKQLINFFLPTLAATAGTLPLLLLFNNTYTLGSILANLLTALLLPRLIWGALIGLFLGSRTIHLPFLISFINRGVTTIFSISKTTMHLSPLLITTGYTSYLISGSVMILVRGGGYVLYKILK